MSSDCANDSPEQPLDTPCIKEEERPAVTLRKLFKEYARENPEIVVAWFFGIGFALGWKLKPW